MLGLVISLLVIALIAAALGFGGIAGAAAGIAKIIFFIFIGRAYPPIVIMDSMRLSASRGEFACKVPIDPS